MKFKDLRDMFVCLFVCWSLTSLCHSNGHIENLRDMYIQHFVYEFVNDSLPKSLSHIFEYNRDIHRHNTRHSYDPRPL